MGWRLVLKKKGEKMLSGPGSQRRRAGFCVGLRGDEGKEHPAVWASRPPGGEVQDSAGHGEAAGWALPLPEVLCLWRG